MANRRQFLAADDEDQLIALQEQMRASQAAPSAAVTRITRPSTGQPAPAAAAAAGPICSAGHPNCTHDHSGDAVATPSVDALMASMQSALKGIVGDVKERAPPAEPPAPPAPLSTGSAAFPAAVNRKQSKFSLARRRAEPAAPPQPVPVPTAATAPVGGPPLSDADAISAESAAVLAAMTPKQVAAAREEVLSRLAPGAAEFLRRRGAQKAAAAAAATTTAVPASSLPSEPVPRQGEARQAPAAAAGPSQPAAGPTAPPTFNPAASTPPVDLSPAAVAGRLRFDASGAVVGLSPVAAVAAPTHAAAREVTTRDPLRQAEGTAAAEGYTLDEACVLARSSVPQQRVYALRTMGGVVAAAKPPGDGDPSSGAVPLPDDVSAALRAEKAAAGGAAGGAGVTWGEVWRHALHAAQVPVALRVALDDPHPAVVTAATEALAALLAPSAAVAAAAAAAAAAPAVGLPAAPWRHLQRPTPSAAWVAAPVDLQTRRQRRQAAAEEGSEEGDDVDERELAKVDPMTGLINMQLLERISFVLGDLRAPGSAAPALAIVAAVAGAGPDAARKAAAIPGMMEALTKALQPPASVEAQVPALRALGALCQGSPAAARAAAVAPGLLTQGVLPLLLRVQASGQGPSEAAGTSTAAAAELRVLCEALRLWRCLTLHGHFLVSGDDVYPALCRLLAPAVDCDSSLVWETAREGLLALAQLRAVRAVAAGAEEESRWVSRECATAVAHQTAEWVAQLPLTRLLNGDAVDATVMGAVAAALHFLDAHWASAAEWASSEDKAADLGALERAGLLGDGPAAASLGSLISGLLKSGLESGWPRGAPPLFTAAAAAVLALERLAAALGAAPAAAPAAALRSPSLAELLEILGENMDPTLLQPWDVPCLQAALQLARCVAAAGGGAKAAAVALRALPPGAEDTALHLMARLFSKTEVRHALEAAASAIEERREAVAPLLAEAGGAAAPPQMPPAAAAAQVLLAGYAAEWLGFVQEEAPEASDAAGPQSLAITSVPLCPDGSRLPLPRGWALAVAPVPPPGSHVSAPPAVAVSYALLWSLGTDLSLQQVKAGVQLAFDPPPQQAQLGDEAWREPLARWALAAIMAGVMAFAYETRQTLLTFLKSLPPNDAGTGGPGVVYWTVPEVQRLVEAFCGGSFGDALFGAGAATALAAPLAPLDVQLEALAGLADGRALHLLPPLASLPGPAVAYLQPPTTGDAKQARMAEDTYVNLLGAPDTLKCVQTGSMVLPLLLHRLAAVIFAEKSGTGMAAASSAARRGALLSGAVRRLGAAGAEGRAALSALLRWDCGNLQAGDVVAAPRLALLEAACGGAGQEGLMAATLAALEEG